MLDNPRNVILVSAADMFVGMSAAWAIAALVAFTHLALTDALYAFILTMLAFTATVSVRVITYDKHKSS